MSLDRFFKGCSLYVSGGEIGSPSDLLMTFCLCAAGFTRKTNVQQLAKLLGLHDVPQFSPRYNIAPSALIACVRAHPESQEKECVQLKWGLGPAWVKDPSIGYKMINARAETVAEKPAFRKAYRRQRRLVLADGFYEWKREGKAKPYYIHFTDNRPFAFAGLWERWEKDGEPPLDSSAMLTTDANTLMKPIHHRMPFILNSNDYFLWLVQPRRTSQHSLFLFSRILKEV